MAKYIKTEQGYKTKEELAIQPDWNQNDPNAPDYVKNRTHYEGHKTIIEGREVRLWFEGGEFAASRMPQVGEKLTVTLNGNAYKCTAWELRQEGEVCLGNGDFDSISDRGENVPFFAVFWRGDEGAGAFIATAMIGENTISIVDDSGNTLIEGTFSVEVNVDEPMYSGNYPLDQPLIVGNTYKVVYDGVPYECVAWEEGDICLGNGEIDGYEHSEDVLFMIGTCYADNELVWYLACYGSDSHTVSVDEVVVHKLDPKYLPSGGDNVFIVHCNQSGDDAGEFYISESVEEVKNAIAEGKAVLLQVNKDGNFANFVGKSGLDLYFVGFVGTATDDMNFYLYHLYVDGSVSRDRIYSWA